MATEDVKLLSVWSSPYAMRAILALEAKGVKYDLMEEDLRAKSQLLLESNPVHKKVPVLLHNGKAISESLIIVRYVDEAWPEDESRPGFFPKDPFGRATMHFWSDFIDKKIIDASYCASIANGESKEAASKELSDHLMTLESGLTKLDADPFFNGGNIGYADICLAPLVAWEPIFEPLAGIHLPTAEKAPRLHRLFDAIREHPAAKAALPDQQKLMAFARMWRQRLAAST